MITILFLKPVIAFCLYDNDEYSKLNEYMTES